ncbi:hypothetical protein J2Y38_004565 [Flavobacterium sp. 2755]|nr:hypothetical protein [Flavobacterium sp. 2755]
MNTKVHCYSKDIILQAVYFKLRFTLSYRDVEEIIKIWECLWIMPRSNAMFISLHLSLS